MRAKLVVVTDEDKERLISACDFPISYMTLKVYLWEMNGQLKYNQRLSTSLNKLVRLKVMSVPAYEKSFNVLARTEAEERHFAVFQQCVDDLKSTFLQLFDDLRKKRRVYNLKGEQAKFITLCGLLSFGQVNGLKNTP